VRQGGKAEKRRSRARWQLWASSNCRPRPVGRGLGMVSTNHAGHVVTESMPQVHGSRRQLASGGCHPTQQLLLGNQRRRASSTSHEHSLAAVEHYR
jgi:hypothetical protein